MPGGYFGAQNLTVQTVYCHDKVTIWLFHHVLMNRYMFQQSCTLSDCTNSDENADVCYSVQQAAVCTVKKISQKNWWLAGSHTKLVL